MSSDFRAIPGALAAGNLASSQFLFMIKNTTDHQVTVVTDANASRPIGILQNDPAAAGDPAEVAYDGVCKVTYGDTITAGDTLASNDSGQAIPDVEVANGGAVDLHHLATALEAGSSGDVRLVLLHTPIRIGSQ